MVKDHIVYGAPFSVYGMSWIIQTDKNGTVWSEIVQIKKGK